MSTPDGWHSTQWHIDAYGDSTQWGAVAENKQATLPAPALLEELLRIAFDDRDIVVHNKGVPGLDTVARLDGQPGMCCAWSVEMNPETPHSAQSCFTDETNVSTPCGSQAAWVINNTAINDMHHRRGGTGAEFKERYRKLAHLADQVGRRFIIETPNPVQNAAPELDRQQRLAPYIVAQRELAAEEGIAIVDQFRVIGDYLGDRWTRYMADVLHPSSYLYSFKALNSFWVFYHLFQDWPVPKDPVRRDVLIPAWETHMKTPHDVANSRAAAELLTTEAQRLRSG